MTARPHADLRRRADVRGAPDRVAALRERARPLPPVDSTEFGDHFTPYAGATVVLIGEATHGTSEFYSARAAITRRLIERHGFTIVAIEADWPDANRIDRYVRHRPMRAVPDEPFSRFPTWMWRNAEVAAFVEWLRRWNADRPQADRTEFRGLDVYSLRGSIAAVLDHLDRSDPAAAAEARRRYGCLTPWQADFAAYGRDVVVRGLADCEQAVVEQLHRLLERRLERLAADGEEHFDAAQNARVVHSAEQYYRAMYRGSAESWNLRDRHMFDTLRRLLDRRGTGARAVVWAHNSHIGDASATEMGWSGELNIGELCRAAFRRDAVAIGMGTDRGTVAAASDWDAPMEIKTVRPVRDDSWEHDFRAAAMPASLTDWRGDAALREVLDATRLERAIGVIYRPETERASHYFEARLGDQFDAWLWFEQTRAVTPIGPQRPHGAPDTWPFGV